MKNDDGTVFGPTSLEQIKEWADSAQVSPLDKVSLDGVTWNKAPTLPELEMDFLLEVDEDQYYGPTTLGAVCEFLRVGEVNPQSLIINCKHATQHRIRDFQALDLDLTLAQTSGGTVAPGKTNIRQSLQARVRELEKSIMEERKKSALLKDRHDKLAARFEQATGKKA